MHGTRKEHAYSCGGVVGLVQEKRLWRRYIYLWLYYAVFEELDAKDLDRARDVYNACLSLIPHKEYVARMADTAGCKWIEDPRSFFTLRPSMYGAP